MPRLRFPQRSCGSPFLFDGPEGGLVVQAAAGLPPGLSAGRNLAWGVSMVDAPPSALERYEVIVPRARHALRGGFARSPSSTLHSQLALAVDVGLDGLLGRDDLVSPHFSGDSRNPFLLFFADAVQIR